MMTKRLLILPGDGIGPEIMSEVARLIDWFDTKGRIAFEVETALVGGAACDAEGAPVSEATMAKALAA
ncbi:MAG: isocitrate/isopropylmalate family dehydrogenase, partial [Aliidongia sp.]